ncbi:hypothetical protein D9757_011926 [Collybiopsis confluens]|uniref:Uncharacterized protein n=1 Tax=Collybiopsis confluens TaxID=2823264 RepID=A0A8H5LRJ3_9AGAR|nr:hypothetical protein D9757_011926 [Collybiopsis confluens]
MTGKEGELQFESFPDSMQPLMLQNKLESKFNCGILYMDIVGRGASGITNTADVAISIGRGPLTLRSSSVVGRMFPFGTVFFFIAKTADFAISAHLPFAIHPLMFLHPPTADFYISAHLPFTIHQSTALPSLLTFHLPLPTDFIASTSELLSLPSLLTFHLPPTYPADLVLFTRSTFDSSELFPEQSGTHSAACRCQENQLSCQMDCRDLQGVVGVESLAGINSCDLKWLTLTQPRFDTESAKLDVAFLLTGYLRLALCSFSPWLAITQPRFDTESAKLDLYKVDS